MDLDLATEQKIVGAESIKLVCWATPQDYNEAVQTPELCFDDPELQRSAVELNLLGLPKPASGNFATVYRFVNQSTNESHAVRCFLRRVGDVEEARYAAIAAYLEDKNLPSLLPFEYQREGIRVNAQWHPIVKMAWSRGCTMGEYIAQNLRDSQTLIALRDKFAAMVSELHTAEIAHGDLQHANIMVNEHRTTDGDTEIFLELVDYDGVYVPAFKTDSASELGHRNYQHPKRRPEHFGPYLDNFSARLIYESLTILAIDPSLYHKFYAGDECILFKHADLLNPAYSDLFRHLCKHENKSIRSATKRLLAALEFDIADVPPLGEQIREGDLPDAELRKLDGGTIIALLGVAMICWLGFWLISSSGEPSRWDGFQANGPTRDIEPSSSEARLMDDVRTHHYYSALSQYQEINPDWLVSKKHPLLSIDVADALVHLAVTGEYPDQVARCVEHTATSLRALQELRNVVDNTNLKSQQIDGIRMGPAQTDQIEALVDTMNARLAGTPQEDGARRSSFTAAELKAENASLQLADLEERSHFSEALEKVDAMELRMLSRDPILARKFAHALFHISINNSWRHPDGVLDTLSNNESALRAVRKAFDEGFVSAAIHDQKADEQELTDEQVRSLRFVVADMDVRLKRVGAGPAHPQPQSQRQQSNPIQFVGAHRRGHVDNGR